ncbi:DUF4309 domain-containing protein [Bacillus sp. RO1]|uniref:DUF4309 domain-containing protein n=1 Tax=Bacillus sp. RO1 TaxID=2722703 RepID=UPI00145722ED|nr:DUF4309 domain-containing protein [Bacillus sp. RO1]NLP51243.1 DUF4309 domain-containing protein [Bacillus sp. RO1]
MEDFDKEVKREINSALLNVEFSEKEKQLILSKAENKRKQFSVLHAFSLIVAIGVFTLLTISFISSKNNQNFSPADIPIVEQKEEPTEKTEPETTEREIEKENTVEPETAIEDEELPESAGKIDKELLRSLSDYEFQLMDGENPYEMFLYLDDTNSLMDVAPEYVPYNQDTEQPNKFKLFLAEKNSSTAHYQVHLSEQLVELDLTSDFNYSFISGTVGTKTLLSMFKELDIDNYVYAGFVVKDGKLALLDITEEAGTLHRQTIKLINNQYLQTVHQLQQIKQDDPPYEYKTWQWNEESIQLELIDSTILQDESLWDYVFTKWTESDIYSEYNNFKNIEFSKELFKDAHEGKLTGVEFSLGDKIEQVHESRAHPKSENYYQGAKMTFYWDGGYAYPIDGSDEILAIFLHPHIMKVTSKEVREILGEPDQVITDSEVGSRNYMVYEFGDYSALFGFENEGEFVNLNFRESKGY